jgi:hypothetical protein
MNFDRIVDRIIGLGRKDARRGRWNDRSACEGRLLSQSRWSEVGLTDVIRHQLAPYTTATWLAAGEAPRTNGALPNNI